MKFIEDWSGSAVAADVGTIAVFSALAIAAYAVVRLLLPVAMRAAGKSKSAWDDIILDSRVRHRIALLGPAAVFYAGVRLAGDASTEWRDFLLRCSAAIVVLLVAMTASAVLRTANALYETKEVARDRPIEPFIQIVVIATYLAAAVLVAAILADQPPWFFIGSIGAIMAVLLLIFKDTILSVVASIQLVQNDMVDVGDWIEMPEFDADGHVVDVKLHTVTVQNFDKTITTIPSYKLVSGAFRNWRGMEETGHRRIKRSIPIDISTIRFLTEDEVERLSHFEPLQGYVALKRTELDAHNSQFLEVHEIGDPRRLTNIGTLRAYIVQYLRRISTVDTDGMNFLVRQLDPGPEGLPLEVMVFANATALSDFEGIQSDIFDHILAMVPNFGLRLFQCTGPPTDDNSSLPIFEDATDLRMIGSR